MPVRQNQDKKRERLRRLARERQRRHRRRLRTGAVIVPVELLPIDIERLLDCGWVTEEDALSLTLLGRAFRSAWERSPPVNSPQKTVTALRTALPGPDRIPVAKRDAEQ